MRELRQHASRYLREVESSREPVEITDRGRPVARLVPIAGDDWANLIAGGEIIPADSEVELHDIGPAAGDYELSRAVQELREDER